MRRNCVGSYSMHSPSSLVESSRWFKRRAQIRKASRSALSVNITGFASVRIARIHCSLGKYYVPCRESTRRVAVCALMFYHVGSSGYFNSQRAGKSARTGWVDIQDATGRCLRRYLVRRGHCNRKSLCDCQRAETSNHSI
jgi:hypothetical protein